MANEDLQIPAELEVTDEELREYGEPTTNEIDNPEAYKYFVPMKLDFNEEKDVIKYIENDIEKIKKEYDEIGYYDKIDRAKSELDYIKSEDTLGGMTKKKLVLIATYCEIIAGKGTRQTMGARPIFQLERDEKVSVKDLSDIDLRNREDRLDYIIRNKIRYEELIKQAYRLGTGYPACIVKIPFSHEVSPPFKHIVKYSPETADKYETKYAKNLKKGEGKRFTDWEKLKAGETIYVEEDTSKVDYHGAKPYIVDLNNFYARPGIKLFKDQPGVHEMMNFAWTDIEARARSKYYDKDAISDLKDYYESKDKGKPLEDIDYTIWESTILYQTKRDKQIYRYKVTFDEESRIILKKIYFPYIIGKPEYEVYSGFPKHDSWIGYCASEKLEDIVSMINSLINSIFAELGIAHNRILLTDDTEFVENADRRTVSISEGEVRVMSFTKGSQFKDFPFTYSPTDRMPLLQWAVNMSDLLSGVSAALLSGQETPTDPNAPYAKAALKYKASNLRIEDVILSLQKTDELVAEHVEMIEFQFNKNRGKDTQALTDETYEKKLKHVCQGSSLAFDKVYDNQVMFAMIEFIKSNYPEVWNDLPSRYAIFGVVLNNAQGSIERIKDILMQPIRRVLDSHAEIEQLIQQLLSKGVPLQQIMKQVSGIPGFQGGGQPVQTPAGGPAPEHIPKPPASMPKVSNVRVPVGGGIP